MKKAQFTTKALLSLIMVVVLIGSMGILSFAEDTYKNYNLSYGEIVPTDAKLEAQKQSYTFYGDSAELYFMQISKGKANARFSIEIFTDKNYQSQIQSYSAPYSLTAGNKALKLTWNFKNLDSGAYYGRCYSYTETETDRNIDTASIKTFVINVDRLSKREVKLKSLVNTAQGPKVTWEAVPTAKTYNIYRRAAGEKSWTYLYTERTGATSYTDKTATSGKYYAYTVKCYDGKYVSLYNKTGINNYYLSMPQISISATGTAGAATLKWNKVPGAAGYNIYRKGGSLSDYSWTCIAKIQNGNTVTYTDKTATSTDWKYTYTVKAYYGKYVSAYKADGVNFNYIPAPTLTKASPFETGMKIEWKANNTNITGYYVYRKNGTSWKYLGYTKNKSFIDTTAVSNNTYTYTVKAVSATNVGAYSAKGITAKFLKAPALQKLTFDSSYKALVRWEKVAGASGYKVYRKIANAKSWTLVTTIKNGATTYYNDACAKSSGTKYTYTVRAFDSNNLHSYFVTAGTSGICLAKPYYSLEQIFPTEETTAIQVSWGAINGATKYNVYRRVPGGTWGYLELGITDTTYIDSTAEIGITYDYAVRALNDSGDMSAFYTKSIKPVIRPVIESVTASEEGSRIIWNAIENADAYTVYRRAEIADGWEAIETVTEAEYLDASEEAKTQHFYYAVSATFGETESALSNNAANFVLADISAEYIPATEDAQPAIKVTVDYESDPNEVKIYKSTNGEAPDLLDDVNATFTDTEIDEGCTYTYTLIVAKTGKLKNQISATAKFPHPPLAKALITDCKGEYNEGDPFIVLTWEEVEFADEYIIYRADNEGEWTEVGKVVAEPETPDIPETDEPSTDPTEPSVPETDESTTEPTEPSEPETDESTTEPTEPSVPETDESTTEPTEPSEPETEETTQAVEITEAEEEPLYGTDSETTTTVEEETTTEPETTEPETTEPETTEPETTEPETTEPETTEPDEEDPTEPVVPKKTYTFKDENVSSEIEYTYKVVAVATKSERESSESDIASCLIKTLLDKLTGIKFDAEKAEKPLKVSVTITWDEVKYAEKYQIRRYLAGEDTTNDEIGELIGNVSADTEILSCTDNTADVNTEYIYKVKAFSEDRGTVENTETFCWIQLPDADEYISLISLLDSLKGDFIYTQALKCNDISEFAVAKEGYTIETTKDENAYYGTGCVMTVLKDGEAVKAYTIIVKADINGDGVCDALDCTELEKHINNHKQLDGNGLAAADLNNDGIIDAADLELMLEKL